MRIGLALVGCLLWVGSPVDGADASAEHSVSLVMREVASLAVDGDVVVTGDGGGSHLRYTAIVGQKPQTVRAAITAGEVPAGTRLRLGVRGFDMHEGSAASVIELSASPTVLIAGVGSCATGEAGAGPELVYRWAIDDPGRFDPDAQPVAVTVSFWLGGDRADQRVVLAQPGISH